MKAATKTLAIALEAVGCSIIAAGIAIEVSIKAPIGYIAITAGALAVAVGSMVWAKIYKERRDRSK